MSDSDSAKTDSATLCDICGLTDKHLRRLAQAGYFPPPHDGKYLVTPSLKGLFKYYREMAQRSKSLGDEKTREEIEKLRLHNGQKRGDLIPFIQVEAFMVGIVSAAKGEARRLELELPPKVQGLDLAEITPVVIEQLDRVFGTLADLAGNLPTLKADAKKTANDADDDASGGGPTPSGEVEDGAASTAEAEAIGLGESPLPARAAG